MQITANVGGWDRIIRLILAIVLIVLGLTGVFQGALEIIGYIVAAIALITGLVTYCPLNALLGFNSRKQPESDVSGESPTTASTDWTNPEDSDQRQS